MPKRPPVERLPSSQGLEERPIATPSRGLHTLPEMAPLPLPAAPLATGQLTLDQLGACQFKPYPNQPNLPQRLPFNNSMRQLTWWDLPNFINGPKVIGSPGSTVATTVLESQSEDLGSSRLEACQNCIPLFPNMCNFPSKQKFSKHALKHLQLIWTSFFNIGSYHIGLFGSYFLNIIKMQQMSI